MEREKFHWCFYLIANIFARAANIFVRLDNIFSFLYGLGKQKCWPKKIPKSFNVLSQGQVVENIFHLNVPLIIFL